MPQQYKQSNGNCHRGYYNPPSVSESQRRIVFPAVHGRLGSAAQTSKRFLFGYLCYEFVNHLSKSDGIA